MDTDIFSFEAFNKLTDQGLSLKFLGWYFIFWGDWGANSKNHTQVYEENGLWIFRKWEYIPGPGYDDFEWSYTTLDQAVEAAYSYYFSSPTLIEDWIIPLHSHPELNAEHVTTSISNAGAIKAEDFTAIEKDRRLRFQDGSGLHRWEQALKWHFLTCGHEFDNTITLRLRRDMQEAFIVQARPAAPHL